MVAVIHQPRYDTLQLFDDLILLAVGGSVVYAGPTEAPLLAAHEDLSAGRGGALPKEAAGELQRELQSCGCLVKASRASEPRAFPCRNPTERT